MQTADGWPPSGQALTSGISSEARWLTMKKRTSFSHVAAVI